VCVCACVRVGPSMGVGVYSCVYRGVYWVESAASNRRRRVVDRNGTEQNKQFRRLSPTAVRCTILLLLFLLLLYTDIQCDPFNSLNRCPGLRFLWFEQFYISYYRFIFFIKFAYLSSRLDVYIVGTFRVLPYNIFWRAIYNVQPYYS